MSTEVTTPPVELWLGATLLGTYPDDGEAIEAATKHAELNDDGRDLEYEIRRAPVKFLIHRPITGPDAPALGAVLTISSTELDVVLDRRASGPTEIQTYKLQRLISGVWTDIASGLFIFGAGNVYHDTALSPSTEYFYRCRAIDTTLRASEWSYSQGTTASGAVNQAPVWSGSTTLTIQQGSQTNIAGRCSDPNGDQITFSKAGSTPANVTVSSTGTVSVGTNATVGGPYTLTVQASDGALTANRDFSLTITAASVGTNYDIGPNEPSFNASQVQPGDTITIKRGTGTRGPLTISNAIGTSGSRITVLSDPTGLTTIRRSSPGSGGFVFVLENCHFVDFDFENANVSAAGAADRCGLKVTYASGSTGTNKDSCSAFVKLTGNNASGNNVTDNCTFSYLFIDGGWAASGTSYLANGVGVITAHHASSKDGTWQENVTFEYCYVRNIEGEGLYVGANYADNDIPMRNVEISHCTVENTGQDGINGKQWWEGANSVHHCSVINCGRVIANTGVLSGIAMMGSTASVYNNWVQGSGGPGIRFATQKGPMVGTAEGTYGTYNTFACEAYNNVVVENGQNANVTGTGIVFAAGPDVGGVALTRMVPAVYNNTCVNNRQNGISSASGQAINGSVRNNIALGNGSTQIVASSSGTASSNNLTTGTVASTFSDPGNDNYHLSAAGGSASEGCYGTRGTDYPTTDYDGDTKSATPASANQGAYEYP